MIYLNNAATSWPKAPEVAEAMRRILVEPPADHYREHVEGTDAAAACRLLLATLYHTDPARVIFTSGATEGLNIALSGLGVEGRHVVTTAAEHNSLLRPLWRLEQLRGTRVAVVPVDGVGRVAVDDIVAALTEETALVCLSHAGNVTGAVQPVEDICEICRRRNITVLIDAAQSAGHIALDLERMPLAVIAVTGHKGLGGPQGVGALILGVEVMLEPVKVGGSGIHSLRRDMPDVMPLRYEAGTQNLPGIAGLGAALELLPPSEVAAVADHCRDLCGLAADVLTTIAGLRILAPPPDENPCGIISFTLEGWSPRDVGFILRQSYDIRVRNGLHCAPLIHQYLGSAPDGSVRLSVSRRTTRQEMLQTVGAVAELAASR